MVVLWRKQNFRNIRLDATTLGERVELVGRDGAIRWARWMGFISAAAARSLHTGRSVRILISRVGEGEFRDLSATEYVHGCQVEDSVWAVADLQVRIVPGPQPVRDP